MKRLISLLFLYSLTLCGYSQIRTATEVTSLFSIKNLTSNHREFDSLYIVSTLGLPFDVYDIKGAVSTIDYTVGDKMFHAFYASHGGIDSLVSEGKTLMRAVYNSHSQIEVLEADTVILAITYDKKGRVASEAKLYPVSSSSVIASTASGSKTQVTDTYIFTDAWQKQSLDDSLPRVYLYSMATDGRTIPWAIDRMYVYEYNGSGCMTKKIDSGRKITRNAIYEFSYKKKKLSQQIKTYTASSLVEGSTFFYENGVLSKVNKGFFRSAKGKNPPLISSETTIMTYDSLGRLVEYVSYDGHRRDICAYTYDANNRIVTIVKRMEDGRYLPLFQCEYDEKSRVVKYQEVRSRGTASYVWDNVGNWNQCTMTDDNGKETTVRRSIQYR